MAPMTPATASDIPGAMVTLAVILGLQAIFFLLGGFRIAKRNKASSEMSQTQDPPIWLIRLETPKT
jgi:hypothetical protein